MVLNNKYILLLLLLQVLYSSCSIQFVLLVDDLERDNSIIETVGVAVDRINDADTLLADKKLYSNIVQTSVSIY